MSLAPVDPELAPETIRIPLAVALGEARHEVDAHAPVYQYVVAEPVAPVRITPRASELLRTSYELEQRSDIAAASRAVLVEFISPASR